MPPTDDPLATALAAIRAEGYLDGPVPRLLKAVEAAVEHIRSGDGSVGDGLAAITRELTREDGGDEIQLDSTEVAAWLKDAPARRNDELHPDSRSAIAARLAAAARTAERERILVLLDAWRCSCGEDGCSYYETRDQIATLIGDPDAT